MKKYSFITLLLIIIVGDTYGQSLKLPQTVLSPNAASLGKYGDVQMSYYTGKADVSVPLFSLNDQNIPLDISLNYDTGGVRVADLPSWVGQNWNLVAGGVITRTEKGRGCDEFKFEAPFPNYAISEQGYFYTYPFMNTPLWTNDTYLKGLFPNGILNDMAPDIFTFNFMGYTGKFFLGSDGNWKVQSESNIKVELNFNDKIATLGRTTQCVGCHSGAAPPKSIGKITLTDDKGNKYVFGNNNLNAIEYSNNNFFSYWNSWTKATAWYLTNVYDRFGNQVYTFNYERSETPGENDFQARFYLSSSYSYINQGTSNGGPFTPVGSSGCSYGISTRDMEGSLIMPVYLKSINTINGYNIIFNRSLSGYKYYTPSDADGTMNSRFGDWAAQYDCMGSGNNATSQQLLYDFYLLTHTANDTQVSFGSGIDPCQPQAFLLGKLKYYKLDDIVISCNSNFQKKITMTRNSNLNERLNLLGISILNGTSPTISKYSFEYKDFALLPYYLSKAIDHWGFYRGADFQHYQYNYLTFPNYIYHYASRSPNATNLLVGSLKRITYPTKGYTEFEFERHDYSRYVDATFANGIYLADESDIAGGLRVKKIITSDGVNIRTKDFKYTSELNSTTSSGILALRNKYMVTDYVVRTEGGSYYNKYSFSINNLLPMSNFSGSHIGYSKVYEIESGNGYTEYQYTDFADYPDVLYNATLNYAVSMYDERWSNDFKRGRLKKTSVFSESNATQSLQTKTYHYSSTGSYYARGFSYNFFNPCGSNVVKIGNAYQMEYSDFNLDLISESEFLNGATLTKTYNKYYSIYPNTNAFFGDTFLTSETATTYSSETKGKTYNYPFTSPGSVENSMIAEHLLPITETIDFGTGGTSNTISKSKNIYTLETINGNSHPAVTTVSSAKDTNGYVSDLTVDKYDNMGNILQYHKRDGRNISFRYSSTNLLLFKAEGALWSEVLNPSNFSTFNTNSAKKATGYTYNTFRDLLQITYPTGIIEKYSYDTQNRLEKILDGNDKVVKKFEYNIK